MSNEIFKIGPIESAILEADSAWEEYARNNDIANPWEEIEKLRRIDTKVLDDGSTFISIGGETDEEIEQLCYWREQRGLYRKIEYVWELIWLMGYYGYEYAQEFARLRDDDTFGPNQIWDIFCNLMPCKYDGECNIYCKRFELCAQEGFKQNGVN